MPKYNVSIEITSKSFHEDEIEAESETDAEDVAKGRFWDDEYEDDLNMNKENPHMIPPDRTVCTFPIKEKDDKEEED